MPIDTPIADIPANPADRRIWVVGELRRRGTSLSALARGMGVSSQALSNALLMPSQYAEQAIAEALGIPVQQLFAERFAPDGQRLPQTRPPQRNTARTPRNLDHEEAA